jgi:transcriptional regulator with XRE-family HTH domain
VLYVASTAYTGHVKNDLGELIRRRRRELGLVQEQLAARVGISQVAVSEWERGVVVPSKLAELAEALDVPLDRLTAALATNVLGADDVESAILRETRIPMNVRQSLVTVYKEVLARYGAGTVVV